MSAKKKGGKPKISYRELMSNADAESKVEKKPVESIPVAQSAPGVKARRKKTTEATKAAEATETPVPQKAPEPVPSSATLAPATPSVLDAATITPSVTPPVSDLPPARRRDRSRELTPRELAAVLNEEQMKAAAEKAAAAAKEAEGEIVAPLTIGELPPVAEPRSSGEGEMTDTMEFAVAAAVATLPFRDRVRARAGIVEVLLFRIGAEIFATDLTAAEEVIEAPRVHRVPEMPDQMLGFFSLRGKLLPVFSPSVLLGASLSREQGAAVVLRAGEKRVALAIDDVDDVMPLDLARLRDVPAASDPEGVLLGVAWRENELVSLIDAESLLAACQSEQLVETA